ncbi:MAG: GAF domain-containing protein [Elusimicrobia bacterium]|nr:GAF domain-containing protein [Elusimicrobiota bacterium]
MTTRTAPRRVRPEGRVREKSSERRYRALVEFGRKLRGVARLRPQLHLIADEVRRVLGAARCSVFLVDEETGELWTHVAHGLEGRELRLPLSAGIIGRVVATGEAIRVDDAYADPRFNAAVDRETGYRTRSILAVPLQDGDGRTFGVFEVLNKRGGAFDEEDEALLRILGSLAGAGLENARLYESLRESYLETLHRLARMAEYRDTRDTGPHLRRIGRYSRILAESFGLPEARAEAVEFASPLHDIGKVGIADAILRKEGPLTPPEMEEMKKHARLGWEILSKAKSPLLRLAAEIALGHHERWDGSGYPAGLAGEKVPVEAAIVAVADVFDALTARRAYKPAWSFRKSADFIAAGSGRLFHPGVARAFAKASGEIARAWREEKGDA